MGRHTLDSFMSHGGEVYEIIRDGVVRENKGLPNEWDEEGRKRKCVQFNPDIDIKEGDILVRKITGEKWLVEKVDPFVLRGVVDFLTVFYIDEKKQKIQSAQSINYTFNNSSNIIAGNQTSAIINVSLDKIRSEIELQGGTDKKELLDLVNEIQQTFEKKDTISKNSFSKFSEMLERHSWITGSLVQLVGSAAIQFLIR